VINHQIGVGAMTIELDIDIDQVTASATDVCADPTDMIDRLPVFSVSLSSLKPGFFLRQSGTDDAHVQLLVDAASASELPAILVQENSLRVVDGMHRIEAARLRGEECINARFVDCSDEEAFMLAVKSNTLHGLPLSRADRIDGARRILEWHADWSDRAVAAAAGLSAKTVAGLRRSDAEVHDLNKRLGRDGKRRPVTGVEGRRRAAGYLMTHPRASLREVAREADVSLGTAHDVRAKLRQGLDPVAVGQRNPAEEQESQGSDREGRRDWISPSNGSSLRPRRQGSPPSSWSAISPKLAKDPTIRYTERGRAFLCWMDTRMMQPGDWGDFVDAIPPHWMDDISLIADSVGDAWREFATQLRARQSSAVLALVSGGHAGP
jgi:ParB-like chromosome segregation protein Spo0J